MTYNQILHPAAVLRAIGCACAVSDLDQSPAMNKVNVRRDGGIRLSGTKFFERESKQRIYAIAADRLERLRGYRRRKAEISQIAPG